MNKYEWKLKSFAKGIDPELAVQELERIEKLFGSLTPENVLKASEEPDAVLHKLFEWNNEKAGEKYRLQQARTIINNIEVRIISDGKPKRIDVFEIVTVNEKRQYKNIQVMTVDEIWEVKRTTLQELNKLKNKLSSYDDFTATVVHIEAAVGTLQ